MSPLENVDGTTKQYGYIDDLEGDYCFSRMTEVLS